jgi:hypothetical protein
VSVVRTVRETQVLEALREAGIELYAATPPAAPEEPAPEPRHSTNEHGECASWCEACRRNIAAGRNPDGTPEPAELAARRLSPAPEPAPTGDPLRRAPWDEPAAAVLGAWARQHARDLAASEDPELEKAIRANDPPREEGELVTEEPAPEPLRDGEWLAKYHAERASYGGASREFHERAVSWIRGLPAPAPEPAPEPPAKPWCTWGSKCDEGVLEPDDGCGYERCPDCAAHDAEPVPAPEPTPEHAPARYDGGGAHLDARYAWTPEPERDEPTYSKCTMGVGCMEAGACYAAAQGEPDRCPAEPVGRDVPPPGWRWCSDSFDDEDERWCTRAGGCGPLSEAWACWRAEHGPSLNRAAIEEHERKVRLLTEHRALCVAALRKVQEVSCEADIFDIAAEALHRLDESADGGGL